MKSGEGVVEWVMVDGDVQDVLDGEDGSGGGTK